MSEKETNTSKTKDDGLWAASASEMTGLTPTPAKDAYEVHSYEDILPYQTLQPPNPGPIIQEAPVGSANPPTFRKVFSAAESERLKNKKNK